MTSPAETPAAAARPLRILTLNTWSIRGRSLGARSTAFRLTQLARRIRELDADLVCLQEVWRRSNYALLRRESGLPFAAISDRYGSDEQLETGLVILSRHPLRRQALLRFARNAPYRKTRKGALLVRVERPQAAPLWLVTTHLTANNGARIGHDPNPWGEPMFRGGPRWDPNEDIRREQLHELSDRLAALAAGPILLGGDLNTGPQYPLWWRYLAELPSLHPDLAGSLSFTERLPCTYCNMYAPLGEGEGQLDHLLGFRGARVLDTQRVFERRYRVPPKLIRSERYRRLLGRLWPGAGPVSKPVTTTISDHYGLLAEVDC